MISQTVCEYLKAKGVTISWLAKQLGMNYATLWSQLKRDMPMDTYIRICDLFQLDYNYFFDKARN